MCPREFMCVRFTKVYAGISCSERLIPQRIRSSGFRCLKSCITRGFLCMWLLTLKLLFKTTYYDKSVKALFCRSTHLCFSFVQQFKIELHF